MTVGPDGAKRLSPGRYAHRCALQSRERGRADARSVGNRNVPQWGKGGGGPGNLLMAGCAVDSPSPGSGPRTRRTPEGIDFPLRGLKAFWGPCEGGALRSGKARKALEGPVPPKRRTGKAGKRGVFPLCPAASENLKVIGPCGWMASVRPPKRAPRLSTGNDRNIFRRLSS